jgi:hypothetical protein
MRQTAIVQNPLLRLPAAAAIQALPPEAKAALRELLYDLRVDAARQADKAWAKHKGPMAAYWRAVSVYAGHIARLTKTKESK